MAKSVKFTINLNVDGKNVVVAARTSVEGLSKALSNARTPADHLRQSLLTLTQTAQSFTNISSSLSSLQGMMSGLTAGYNAAQQANTQLTTVMRQRMDATAEDIAYVKQVVSAQKEMGVVSGTVQIRGAQQIATFLKEKESLAALIPAMNNLIAQQKGINNTQEDAYGIANLMGKAMQGQTSALKRVGITFTEAQAQVMQFGTEQERAAMLATIIKDNVGEMNAALAKTDAGQMKQLEMQFAALKSKLGEIAQTALPYVSWAAQGAMLVSSTISIITGFQGAAKAVTNFTVVQKTCNLISGAYSGIVTKVAAVIRLMSMQTTTAAAAMIGLKVAMRGLMIATGVGAAIAAITCVIEQLISANDEAAESAKAMGEAESQAAAEAQQAYEGALKQTYSNLMATFNGLKAKWAELKDEQSKNQFIHDNAAAFEKLGLKINGVADAEGFFKGNTDAVVEAFKRRAKAAAYAAELTNLYGQQLQLETRSNNIKQDMAIYKKWFDANDHGTDAYRYQRREQGARDWASKQDKSNGGDGNIDKVMNEASQIGEKIADAEASLKKMGNMGDLITAPEIKPTTPSKSPKVKTSGNTTAIAKEDDSLDGRIRALEAEISKTKDEDLRKLLQELLNSVVSRRAEMADLAKDAPNMANKNIGQQLQGKPIGKDDLGKVDTSKIELPHIETAIEQMERYRDAIRSLNHIDLSNYESVMQGIAGIKSVADSNAKGFAVAGAACQTLGDSLQQLGADSEAAKVGLVLAAIGQIALSFANALNDAGKQSWITWLAFAISGTATMVSLVSTIAGFTTGGVVGGNQEHGDKIMVGVNSGEMILNKTQQKRLFDLANGRVGTANVINNRQAARPLLNLSSAMPSAKSNQVTLRLRGNSLYGVLLNYNRTNGRHFTIS